ncbi:MAG: 4Fe-4S binding protein [Anaerolineae bacterium]|jgi:ferredoxin-type protein NapH|nr:4Fe-4S binding protein [Anaerolineae bacterium]MDX9829676.1 4Fe-4S binding protein [Anaerolineae bacterium]
MSLYPKAYRSLRRHWFHRFLTFLLGIVLLYAPFALLTRLVLWATGTPLLPDVHRICMRMPIQWLAQPWMYGTMIEQPMYLGAVLVLPLAALFAGPLFCGWLCPAGGITEFLSRLVPPRFQIDLAGKVKATPVRYGFTVGMMGASFVGANVCCSFCNFTHTQNIVSGLLGDFTGLTYWASFTVASFVLWFFVLGLFTRGGRGWCNFLCPAGALQGLAHSLGRALRLGRSVQIDHGLCLGCKSCVSACPAWAISTKSEPHIDIHACNGCMDCAEVCSQKAIAYRPNRAAARAVAVQAAAGD